jgi:hypothetical protein
LLDPPSSNKTTSSTWLVCKWLFGEISDDDKWQNAHKI